MQFYYVDVPAKPNTIALLEKLITSHVIFSIVNLPMSHASLKLTWYISCIHLKVHIETYFIAFNCFKFI